jgi:hypothetical protein
MERSGMTGESKPLLWSSQRGKPGGEGEGLYRPPPHGRLSSLGLRGARPWAGGVSGVPHGRGSAGKLCYEKCRLKVVTEYYIIKNMDCFIKFLNANNGLFSLVFSFFVMISTVTYAILTYVLVKETRKMREIQTEPRIQIVLETFESNVNSIKLNIKNIGQGPAMNIIFKPSVINGNGEGENIIKRFTTVSAFSSGLKYLGPSQSFDTNYYNVITGGIKKEILFGIVLNIEVKYRSITKKKYTENIIINFNELEGSYSLGKPNLFSIAQSLEKIENILYNITSGFIKMKIDTYNSVDREIEKNRIDEMYKEVKNLE